MTKKDYIKIADTLINYFKLYNTNPTTGYIEDPTGGGELINLFEDMLKKDNPKFNNIKFGDYIDKNSR